MISMFPSFLCEVKGAQKYYGRIILYELQKDVASFDGY